LKEGLSLEELESGKKAFVDQMKVQRSDDGLLALQLANSLFVGRNFDYFANLEKKIETLTPGEIQKAYQKTLDPKRLIIIHAGDFKKK
jgi:zinc protease